MYVFTYTYIHIYKYAYRFLVEEPEGKMPLGKLRRRGDDIKMGQKLGWDMNWIHLAQDRDNWRANYREHPFETLAFIKCSEVFGLAKELSAFQGRVMYI
jgi:hypothetical protein